MANINYGVLLWYANVAASALLLARLIRQGLWRPYRILCLYLLTDVVQQVAGLAVREFVEKSGRQYLKIYTSGQAVKVVLLVFVVLELYRNALTEHPAVGRYARKVAGYLMLGAAFVGAGLLWLTAPALRSRGLRLVLEYVFAIERTIDSVSFFLLLFMAAFILWFPVRLSRNIAWCLACFSGYLFARWVALFFVGLFPQLSATLDNAVLTVSMVSFLAMARAMAWTGEERTVTSAIRWNPARMQRLRRQLETLEDHLAALGKKHRNITGNAALHSSEL